MQVATVHNVPLYACVPLSDLYSAHEAKSHNSIHEIRTHPVIGQCPTV